MALADKQYNTLARTILETGVTKTDRTGTGTKSIFGHQMRFDLSKEFPMLTTKRVAFGLIKSELLWFLRGDTNIRYLLENNNKIWTEWAFKKYVESPAYFGPDMTDFGRRCLDSEAFNTVYQAEVKKFEEAILSDDDFAAEHGDLGHVYGYQWRHWDVEQTGAESVSASLHIDQIKDVIEQIKTNPDSRRLIVSAWNPADVPNMALPPCHTLFQFYVADGKLSCQLYQRSGDVFLGIPFNIASYALLTHLIANETGLAVGDFIHTIGDAHLYLNHIDQINEQLAREPFEGCQLVLNASEKSIFEMDAADIALENYHCHKGIKAPIAV